MTVRRWLLPALAACALGILSSQAQSARAGTAVSAPAPEAAARRIMVMLQLGPEHFRGGSDYGGTYGDAMGEKARLRIARKIAREHGLTLLENWPMRMVGVDCVIMEVRDDRSLDAVATEISALPGVAWSQPLNEFQMQSAAAAAPSKGSYNDRLLPAQPWHLAHMHRVATGRGVTIAIIDSRIDTGHPDLAGRIAGVQDFVASKHPLAERHGTGVAGIIAARANNAVGIAGVATGARILGLRACWERPYGGNTVCDTLSLAKALTYALENHANIINLSLTGPQDRLLQTLITLGLQRGATVVAAVDPVRPQSSFPAFVSGVIPVAAQPLSGAGPAVYIAPGQDVPTTEPEGKWSIVSGSSFAAAHVSGLAALLRELSGSARAPTVAAMLGTRGPVDACAVVGRLSSLDVPACEADR